MDRNEIFWTAFDDELEKIAIPNLAQMAGGVAGAVRRGFKASVKGGGSAAKSVKSFVKGAPGQIAGSFKSMVGSGKQFKQSMRAKPRAAAPKAKPAAKRKPKAEVPAATTPAAKPFAGNAQQAQHPITNWWKGLSPAAKWGVGGAGVGIGLSAARGLNSND